MQSLLDLLSLVGMVMFVMMLVFVLWDMVFVLLFEALWYIAMAFIFIMLMRAGVNILKTLSRFFRFGRYKRC